MRPKRFMAIAVLLVVGISLVARAEAPSVLLEKGVYTEETVGDLNAAIEIYKQVIEDADATRAILVQAHHRLALCYVKMGEMNQAAAELRKLLSYPGESELTKEARALLMTLTTPDPATLMPPDTALYVEIGSPGHQVETVLRMLEGTPLANPLAAMAQGAGTQGPGPDQIIGALLNPSMVEEFKKVRGMAVGLQGIEVSEYAQTPHMVQVLFLGESDALRGIITAGLTMAGRPAEPIEGMTTVTFGGPDAPGCAFDENVVITAYPLEALTWCVKQYKGVIDEPTLASGNAAFARLDKQTRQESALTCWVDAAGVGAMLAEATDLGIPPDQIQKVLSFVELNGLEGMATRFVLDEEQPFIEAAVYLREGPPGVLDMMRTPVLSTEGFEAVPPQAFGVASVALDESNAALTGLLLGTAAGLTGLNVPPELFADVEQVTLFVLAPESAAAIPQGDAAALAAQSLGVAITSRNPEQTRALLGQTLNMISALADEQAGGEPEAELDGGIGRYPVMMQQGQEINCYVGQAGTSVVLGLSPEVVRSSIAAVQSGESALTVGPLQKAVGRVGEDVNKVIIVNAGVLLATSIAQQRAGGLVPEEINGLVDEVTGALAGTSLQFQTVEDVGAVTVRLSVNDLPPLGEVLPPLMGLAEYRHPVAAPSRPVDVAYAADPITVDGDLSEWAEVALMPWYEGDPNVGTFQLCWREDGLYGAVQSVDDSIEPQHQEPWTNDGVQLFIEKDCARSTRNTEHSMGMLLWPDPEAGPGDAHISFYIPATGSAAEGMGREEQSGITCSWAPTLNGYALEFFIPAGWLAPAPMEPGAHLGLALLLRNGSISQVASFYLVDRDDTWQRPDTWGAIRLIPPPEAVDVPYSAHEVTMDGDLSEWAEVPALPWTYGDASMGRCQLSWHQDGLYGAVRSMDDRIQVNDGQPWMNDSFQVFIQADSSRSPAQTLDTVQVLFWPDPAVGGGDARILFDRPASDFDPAGEGQHSGGTGTDAESGVMCSWQPAADGYTMEFLIPASCLQPFKMEAGATAGLCLFLKNGSAAPAAAFSHQLEPETWARPDRWGVVRLVGDAD